MQNVCLCVFMYLYVLMQDFSQLWCLDPALLRIEAKMGPIFYFIIPIHNNNNNNNVLHK